MPPNVRPTKLPSPTAQPTARPVAPPRRRRPRWPQITAVVLVLLALVLAGVALLITYELTTPKNRHDDSSYLIEVKAGSRITTIGQQLAAKKLVRSSSLLVLYAKFGPAHGRLLPGTYEFKPSMSIEQMVDNMHNGKIAVRTIIVPEGLSAKQIGKVVQTSNFASAADFEHALGDTYTNPVLSLRPAGTISLEGLLGPSKYQMVITAKPQTLISQMLDQFAKSTAAYQNQTAPQGLNFYQALTLASMVELEAPHSQDRQLIAGVFLNRLKAGMKLQSDVPINYALAQTGQTSTSSADFVNLDSPYNDYIHAGLPPTPVCNPSLDALAAVYHPTPSNYLYFIGGKDGKVYYAATYEQHQANISKYLQ